MFQMYVFICTPVAFLILKAKGNLEILNNANANADLPQKVTTLIEMLGRLEVENANFTKHLLKEVRSIRVESVEGRKTLGMVGKIGVWTKKVIGRIDQVLSIGSKLSSLHKKFMWKKQPDVDAMSENDEGDVYEEPQEYEPDDKVEQGDYQGDEYYYDEPEVDGEGDYYYEDVPEER
uniref:Uncharacterized protein n=1 Tax=Clastoptera arizonana TaxID=38151 RepID=A0A1B6CU53_9HEMI